LLQSYSGLGAINLRDVNLKPNKANKLLQGLALPFSLKAGMIGKLEFKFNILKMFGNSQSIEVNVDEILVILGPNVAMQSNDEVGNEI
jgi:hypothetical protein